MSRVPNRRGRIVMADTFTWFIKYCCIIDVCMRNERCAFCKIVFFGRLGPKYSLCAYLKICDAIETAENILVKNAPTARQPDEQR